MTVDAVDAEGRHVPTEDRLVTFQVDGAAHLIGVNNGDPVSREADKASERRLFSDYARAIVQAADEPGELTIRANTAGLKPALLEVPMVRRTPRPSIRSPRRCADALVRYERGGRAAGTGGGQIGQPTEEAFQLYKLNAVTRREPDGGD